MWGGQDEAHIVEVGQDIFHHNQEGVPDGDGMAHDADCKNLCYLVNMHGTAHSTTCLFLDIGSVRNDIEKGNDPEKGQHEADVGGLLE